MGLRALCCEEWFFGKEYGVIPLRAHMSRCLAVVPLIVKGSHFFRTQEFFGSCAMGESAWVSFTLPVSLFTKSLCVASQPAYTLNPILTILRCSTTDLASGSVRLICLYPLFCNFFSMLRYFSFLYYW